MSFAQWFTRSSPTVSWIRARAATSTLVPTPSVERTNTGRSYPDGTRTIPPNAPISPSASGVRVVRTSAADAAKRRAARRRPHSGRSSGAGLLDIEVDEILEGAHPRLDIGAAHVLEPLHAERLDRERAHRGAVDHGAPQVRGGGLSARGREDP